jgi:hypothetical protein
MTLKQAQKQYDDAISTTVKHEANAMTFELLISIGKMHFSKPSKVLFAQVGVRSSRVITSSKAANNDAQLS